MVALWATCWFCHEAAHLVLCKLWQITHKLIQGLDLNKSDCFQTTDSRTDEVGIRISSHISP